MRRLHPSPATDVDPAGAYAGERTGRPWVLVNMIASVDGATAVNGRSGVLGGPGDRAVFHALRALADTVLVGAGTVRAEGYRAPRPGQGRLAVVTTTGDLTGADGIFDGHRPVLVTTETAEWDEPRADVVRAGQGRVDLALALASLHRSGARVVLCEGGPRLNGDLIAAGLVDEICLTVSPTLVAGPSARVAHRPDPGPATGLDLVHVLEEEGYLFLRYVRRG